MNQNYYNNEYMSKMHKIGKITGVLAVVASFLPALVLGLVYGMWPDWAALGTAFVTATASFGFLWVIEPISYYPVVGPVGTYMAFVSGNISNMRIPCASMAQVSAGVEPGTEKGSIIATIGMGVSVIVNVVILSVGVIAGSSVLAMLPAEVTAALNYLLPALFGALYIQFAMKNIKLADRQLPDQRRRVQLHPRCFQLSGYPAVRLRFHLHRPDAEQEEGLNFSEKEKLTWPSKKFIRKLVNWKLCGGSPASSCGKTPRQAETKRSPRTICAIS